MKDMGVISRDKNQLSLYYNSESSIGKQCCAYVQASDKKVLRIDISKTRVTPTQWSEIAEGLGVQIETLIDKDHPDFKQKYGANFLEMEANDWLKILEKNPKLVQYPILIFGEEFHQLKTGAAFKKYLEPDSADIKRY